MGDATNNARDQPDLGVFAEVISRIGEGESVNAIFKQRPSSFPSVGTFWRAIGRDRVLRDAYEAAMHTRIERRVEEIEAIADEHPPWEATKDGQKLDAGFVAWQKNRIDARKWSASKLLPKKYGDRQVIAGDADNPLIVDDAKAILARRLLGGAAALDAVAGTGDGSGEDQR